ncbi:MAG: methyltransferase family protein [Nitrososphaeria archaeon]
MRSLVGKSTMLITIIVLLLFLAAVWVLNFGLNLPSAENAMLLLNGAGWGLLLIGIVATFLSVIPLFLEVKYLSPLTFVGWTLYLPTLFNILVPMFIVFFSIIGIFYSPWLAFVNLPSANRLVNGIIMLDDEILSFIVKCLGYFLVLSGLAIYIAGLYQLLSHAVKERQLLTQGLYKFVRHPQYFGIMLWTLGFAVLGWRLMNYMMWVFLSYSYILLAENEEIDLVKAYGSRYIKYRSAVPFVIPFPLSLAFKPFGRYLSSYGLKVVSYTMFFLVLAAVLYLWLDPYVVLLK